jgi:hypothetical protein
MGITPERLIEYYPQLFHMAEDGTWENICRKGLLSTTALLDVFGINGPKRHEIESQHRPESVKIFHSEHGAAVIRDQKPMKESSLKKCLQALSPQQWYETLNRKVFFWLTHERLIRLLTAKEYRLRRHCVITVSTRHLLEQHLDRITLSPINSGSTFYIPSPRGANTFLPISDYPFEERRKVRGIQDAIAELAVDYSVPDIGNMVVKVEIMCGDRLLEKIYSIS